MTGQVSPRRRLAACVEAWPEAAAGGYDPRCCRFPKACSADVLEPTAPEVVPDAPEAEALPDPAEVERLRIVGRDAYAVALDRYEPHPWVDVARTVLADLEARYVLVPREGGTVRTDWGIRMPVSGRVFTEPREPGPDLLERGQIKVSRTHIIGPWEAQI